MNHKVILHTVGRIVLLEAILLVIPLIVSVCYGEWGTVQAFGITAAIALALGLVMTWFRPGKDRLFAKGGLVAVALAWIALALIGALPFCISGQIPSYIDAFFETVSGFTTTGASILPDPSILSHGLLFWRSFTHWIGGMGIIVLMLAIMPAESGRSIHILRAEVPGPLVGKLMPRLRDTATILYIIYIGMTLLQLCFMLCGGVPLFESLVYTFGTAGTGGFAVTSQGIAAYSPYVQWVVTVFMLLFGVNFNLYYFLLLRRVRAVLSSGELWCYLGIVLASTTFITINVASLFPSVGDTIRNAAFQVSSIITTTGYATTDFALWPGFSKALLLILMIIGGCGGSTAGGLKVSRVMLLFTTIKQNLKKLLHPRSVSVARLDGKVVDDITLRSASTYFTVYGVLALAIFLLLSLEPFSLETNLSATVACFNNVGPGLGAVGPCGSYAAFSGASKLLLSLAMLLGRLEIYPILVLLSPATWSKKS